jgi:hypothetical protein
VFNNFAVAPDAGGCGGSVAFSDEVRPSVSDDDDDVRWRVGTQSEYVGIAIPAGDAYGGIVF